MRKANWVGALSGIAALAVAAPLWADEPATAGALQFGLGFRYGVELNEGDSNPWGTGLGLEGGYTLPFGLYLGGNAEYFFGNEVDFGLGTVDANIWQISAEGGYDIGLAKYFVIRPKLGLGLANPMVETCLSGAPCSKASDSYMLLAPGAKLMLFTTHFSLSVDLRYAMVMADPETANAFIFSVGVGF